MANTLVDVNDEDLSVAMAYYGTSTKKDTINRALKDAADRRRAQFSGLRELFKASRTEFESMTPAEREQELARLEVNDDTFLTQVTALDAQARDDE